MKRTQAELENIFGGRAVKLCDGRTGLRGGLEVKATAEADAPVIEFVASDDTLDRYDEVIVAQGWELTNYQRNPVFQNSHKYGDVIFTLGKALATSIRGNALVQRIEFAVAINPVAKLAYELYKGGFLNAVSVGFIPLEWEDGGGATAYRRKFIKQELLELSAVSIPANPNALQNAVQCGAVDRGDLRELAAFLKQFCSDKPESDATRAAASELNAAQLLSLARSVRKILHQ